MRLEIEVDKFVAILALATHLALGVARGGVHIVIRLVGIADSQFGFNLSDPLQVGMFMALFGKERVSGLTNLLFALFQRKPQTFQLGGVR